MKKLLSLLLASTALLGFGQIRIVPSHSFTNWDPGIRIGIQPRGGGSFGGGGRSFGGGGGGRSFGGGSFGGSGRSFGGSGGSFGGGSMGRSPGGGSFGSGGRSFGGGSPIGGSSPRSSGSSSFGRTGSMGFSGPVRSTSLNNSYRGVSPSSTYHYNYNGSNVTAFGFGMMSGYSLGWLAPRWYYSTPFSPYFYFNQPYYDPVAGAYYPGGFSFGKFLLGLIIIGFIIWLLVRLFGKGKKVKYTTYQ